MQKSSQFTEKQVSPANETFRELIKFFRDLVVILIIVLFIRGFIITPFRINGHSMEASYHDKEYILVNKLSYLNLPVQYNKNTEYTPQTSKTINDILAKIPVHIGDPKRGDVVVITPHVDREKEYYIKRVIGMPGETIRFEGGKVYIKKNGDENFIELDEKYLSIVNKGRTFLRENITTNEFVIPEGSYWIMGDNRNNSSDSRECFKNCIGQDLEAHFVKRKDIVGKVLFDFGYVNIFGQDGILESGKVKWTHPPRMLSHPKDASYPELGE